ncbi:MAG: 30S ribosomal protein S12 methylthiotransferase RimO [Candidatus Omnitrophica bacterium CG11_big_fil_rev_8_21_14_0_20_41_12]|nr:MAG: 30S ribosomal protein S12 methylthiotransferase RimO [Candidatus Omnitrophica bacterium CG11_big_fil_rev_8_21_14_0_20_41_12]
MKQKLGILSLGCPRNLVDAETLAGRLHAKGYSIVDDLGKAQIALVNTCAFIEEARRESIDAILETIELKKQGKLKKIIVCGCLPQRYKDLKDELPEVDAFIGSLEQDHGLKRYALTPKHYAYLKICEGCLNNCSYCVIPRIKGRLKSLDEKTIIQKVRQLNREKISELNIIGQDITGFGVDSSGKSKLAVLLKKIIKNSPDISWIRLLYLHPERITEELLELIAKNKRVCKYIDLPIQHINNRILKLMNRRFSKEQIIALIKKIRSVIPGVCLRTSLIVGFPSETKAEFNELLDFIKEVKFDRLGAFIYSREEDTPAYCFGGQISKKAKEERFDMIMSEQQKIAAELNKKFMAQSMDVLIEDKQDGAYIGRSQFDAPEVDGVVYVKTNRRLKTGEFCRVKIIDTLEYDLVGELKQ